MGDLILNKVWRPLLTSRNKCIRSVSSALMAPTGGCTKPEVSNKAHYMHAIAEAWHKSNTIDILHENKCNSYLCNSNCHLTQTDYLFPQQKRRPWSRQ